MHIFLFGWLWLVVDALAGDEVACFLLQGWRAWCRARGRRKVAGPGSSFPRWWWQWLSTTSTCLGGNSLGRGPGRRAVANNFILFFGACVYFNSNQNHRAMGLPGQGDARLLLRRRHLSKKIRVASGCKGFKGLFAILLFFGVLYEVWLRQMSLCPFYTLLSQRVFVHFFI